MKHSRGFRLGGFSLIEVIIATGILAMSIVAVIAFLGATAQATSEVLETTVASRIADNVRAELDNEDVDTLFNVADPASPAVLYATRDGERVRLEGPAADAPENSSPPGIDQHNRYFRIEIRRMENSLEFPSGQFPDSAMLPLSVQIIWPYQVPTGPSTSQAGAPERQSRYVFNTVILRKQ